MQWHDTIKPHAITLPSHAPFPPFFAPFFSLPHAVTLQSHTSYLELEPLGAHAARGGGGERGGGGGLLRVQVQLNAAAAVHACSASAGHAPVFAGVRHHLNAHTLKFWRQKLRELHTRRVLQQVHTRAHASTGIGTLARHAPGPDCPWSRAAQQWARRRTAWLTCTRGTCHARSALHTKNQTPNHKPPTPNPSPPPPAKVPAQALVHVVDLHPGVGGRSSRGVGGGSESRA